MKIKYLNMSFAKMFFLLWGGAAAAEMTEKLPLWESEWEYITEKPQQEIYLPWNANINTPTLRGQTIVYVVSDVETTFIKQGSNENSKVKAYVAKFDFTISSELARQSYIEIELLRSFLVKIKMLHPSPIPTCGSASISSYDTHSTHFYINSSSILKKDTGSNGDKYTYSQEIKDDGTITIQFTSKCPANLLDGFPYDLTSPLPEVGAKSSEQKTAEEEKQTKHRHTL